MMPAADAIPLLASHCYQVVGLGVLKMAVMTLVGSNELC